MAEAAKAQLAVDPSAANAVAVAPLAAAASSGYDFGMNRAQNRVVRFAGAGVGLGIVAAIAVCLGTSNSGGLGKPELFITLSFFGMICGIFAGWFAGLR